MTSSPRLKVSGRRNCSSWRRHLHVQTSLWSWLWQLSHKTFIVLTSSPLSEFVLVLTVIALAETVHRHDVISVYIIIWSWLSHLSQELFILMTSSPRSEIVLVVTLTATKENVHHNDVISLFESVLVMTVTAVSENVYRDDVYPRSKFVQVLIWNGCHSHLVQNSFWSWYETAVTAKIHDGLSPLSKIVLRDSCYRKRQSRWRHLLVQISFWSWLCKLSQKPLVSSVSSSLGLWRRGSLSTESRLRLTLLTQKHPPSLRTRTALARCLGQSLIDWIVQLSNIVLHPYQSVQCVLAVSYTHLTLPTRRWV